MKYFSEIVKKCKFNENNLCSNTKLPAITCVWNIKTILDEIIDNNKTNNLRMEECFFYKKIKIITKIQL